MIVLQYEKEQLMDTVNTNINDFDEEIKEMQKEKYRLESDLARCIEYGSTCPTREEARTAFANNERAVLSVPKSRRHIMNISDLSSIHAGPLAEFLGKEWVWGNPAKPIPHKAVYYASRACLGGHHPLH